MVVRDKKGRLVKDLKPSDFEVSEDGVRQEVVSFRLVSRGYGAAPEGGDGTAATATPPGVRSTAAAGRGLEQIGAVALVFDRLSPESRVRARQAATQYLDSGLSPQDFVGVFGVDLSLRVLQPFTNDVQLIRRALARAGSQNGAPNVSRADQVATTSQSESQLQSTADQLRAAAGEATGPAGMSNAGPTMYELAFAQMSRRSLETFDILERNQEGAATMHGLLAVIDALGQLPGRKVLVLFSEGLSIPPAVEAPFRTVISNANRAGVSIYSVDAAGLRALSSDQAAGRALSTLGQQRIRVANSPSEPGSPMMRDMERNEDLMRLNPESGLGQLAEQTGGFLVSSTNNPGAKLRAVAEDLHTYYTISYVPKNENYDGRFRQIGVKLGRPNLEVQTRKGYFAINADYASPVLDYEAPALALLAGAHSPDSFPVHAGAFSFPEAARPGRVPVVVEVPAGSVSFAADAEKKIYRADFSVVALIKDESQRVVRKLSNHYLLSGPLDKLRSASRGAVLFYREAELLPGRYTLAAAVYDAATGRAGRCSDTFIVSGADASKPRLASVVIIDRAERAASAVGQQADNPFRYGELLVYPNLGAPLHKSAVKELALLLTIYAARGERAAPKLTVEVSQSGRTLGKAALNLPAPDETGRVQYASTIPTDKLAPGEYQLTITASDGHGAASRVARFTIEP